MERRSWSDYIELQEQLRGVLSALAPLEQNVLKMRFGLEDEKSHTIKEVCERFGMTRLEVRAVEAKALRRIIKMGAPVKRVRVALKDFGSATGEERRDANKRVWDYVEKFF